MNNSAECWFVEERGRGTQPAEEVDQLEVGVVVLVCRHLVQPSVDHALHDPLKAENKIDKEQNMCTFTSQTTIVFVKKRKK